MARPNVLALPVRRQDLEILRKIGIPFRVIDSIYNAINSDVIRTLPDAIESNDEGVGDAIDIANQALAIATSANATANSANIKAESALAQLADLPQFLEDYVPLFGIGNPEGVVIANFNRMFVDTDGGPDLYVNVIGEGSNIGWEIIASSLSGYGTNYGAAYGD